MAHFAKVNDENIVEEVIVVSNENAPDELTGQEYIASLGIVGTWVQTSYNNNFRGKFAGIGDSYDEANDVFVAKVWPIPEEIIEETNVSA